MNTKAAKFTVLALAVAVLCLPAAVGLGQVGGFPLSDNHAEAELFTRVSDGKVQAVIRVKVEDGWHLYSDELGNKDAVGLPTTVKMGGENITWSRVRFPKPRRLEQKGLGTWINSHDGTILLYATGKLGEGASAEGITAKLDGQTCSETGSCVLYGQSITDGGAGDDALFKAFPKDLRVGDAGGPPAAAVKFPDFAPRGEAGGYSMGTWLLLAFVAGILMNVMPCVLPVISIKVLSFVQQAGESRGRMLALGSLFGAGMLAVFWALAAAAIVLGMNWGEQFQSPAFMVVMISVVFAFALSLLGVFTLGVPRSVGVLAAGPDREGLADAFFKGILATLLATPCSGPFLGSTLAWTLDQTPLTIFGIFTMLGLGMGLPYVVLTAFPKLLGFLPKPGAWMETFKQSMGFVLLVTVIYLMVSLRQDLLLFANAFLVFVAVGCWYWGRFATLKQTRTKRWVTLGAAVAIVAIGAQLSFGTLRGAYAPPEPGEAHIAWEEFDPKAFKEHLDAGRTVFIDFHASWCPNCKYNEKFVFESEEIRSLIKAKGVVAMQADMTHAGPRTEMLGRLRNKLGGRSIPFLAVFPGDRPGEPFVRPDIVSVKTMREIFEACPDPKDNLEVGLR